MPGDESRVGHICPYFYMDVDDTHERSKIAQNSHNMMPLLVVVSSDEEVNQLPALGDQNDHRATTIAVGHQREVDSPPQQRFSSAFRPRTMTYQLSVLW